MSCAFTSNRDISVTKTSLYSFECENGLSRVLSQGLPLPQVELEVPAHPISPPSFEIFLFLLLSRQQCPSRQAVQTLLLALLESVTNRYGDKCKQVVIMS